MENKKYLMEQIEKNERMMEDLEKYSKLDVNVVMRRECLRLHWILDGECVTYRNMIDKLDVSNFIVKVKRFSETGGLIETCVENNLEYEFIEEMCDEKYNYLNVSVNTSRKIYAEYCLEGFIYQI